MEAVRQLGRIATSGGVQKTNRGRKQGQSQSKGKGKATDSGTAAFTQEQIEELQKLITDRAVDKSLPHRPHPDRRWDEDEDQDGNDPANTMVT